MKIRPMEDELSRADTKTDRYDGTNSRLLQFCEKRPLPQGHGHNHHIITHIPAESTRLLRSALFWAHAQRIVVIPYRRLGITYRSNVGSLDLRK
jgi:hypothetical protein